MTSVERYQWVKPAIFRNGPYAFFCGGSEMIAIAGRRCDAGGGGWGDLRRAREAGGAGEKTLAARLLKVLPARIFLSPNGATKLRGV